MGTERDFVVKKGLQVTDDINVSGDINVSSLYGRLNFKKNAAGNVNNDAIYFINGSDQYAGAVKYFHGDNTLRFDANQATQLHISDGAIFPPTDNDVDLGTSSLKFKDSFFGLVDAENFKVNGGQGSDGQILTSTGSGVAWEDAAGGGASALNDLSDAITTEYDNIGIGTNALDSITAQSGNNNVAIGKSSGTDVTVGSNNTFVGHQSGTNIVNGSDGVAIGYRTGYSTGSSDSSQYVVIGFESGKSVHSSLQTSIGYRSGWSGAVGATLIGHEAGKYIASGDNTIAIGVATCKGGSSTPTSGHNNIAIGYAAQTAGFGTGANNVVIGGSTSVTADSDSQLKIASGNGGVTWITGNSSGGINSKAEVVAVSGNTTLTLAQSGSYVYWTGGTLTLPASGTVGTQYTVINNKGSQASIALNSTNCSMISGFTNAAIADHELASFICVTANNWIMVG
jgi:hypothetical protein